MLARLHTAGVAVWSGAEGWEERVWRNWRRAERCCAQRRRVSVTCELGEVGQAVRMVGGDDAAEQLKDVAHGVEHLHGTLGGAAGCFAQRRVSQVQQLLYAQAAEDTQGNTTVTPTVWPGKTKCLGFVVVVT